MTIKRTPGDHGGTIYTLLSGHSFQLEPFPGAEKNSPQSAIFERALDVLGSFVQALRQIEADETLSPLGRERKLGPLRINAIREVARARANVDTIARGFDEREAAMLRVPTVDPTHSAVAIEDREIRDWWRALEPERRAEMMRLFDTEPGHERIELALLRSPVALADLELRSIREAWNRGRRLNNAAETLAIDNGRNVTEWARRGIAHVAGITASVTGLASQHILRAILEDEGDTDRGGYLAFGFTTGDAAEMRRRMAIEAANAARVTGATA